MTKASCRRDNGERGDMAVPREVVGVWVGGGRKWRYRGGVGGGLELA